MGRTVGFPITGIGLHCIFSITYLPPSFPILERRVISRNDEDLNRHSRSFLPFHLFLPFHFIFASLLTSDLLFCCCKPAQQDIVNVAFGLCVKKA